MEPNPYYTPAEERYLDARALLAHAMAADGVTPQHLALAELEYLNALDALNVELQLTQARTA